MSRPKLLYLVHRIPYPPNKGDKIRSFNLLRHLAETFEIHLGAFVDDAEDMRHQALLAPFCSEIHLVPINPMHAKIKSLRGLLSGKPLTLPYYASKTMASWVNHKLADPAMERVLVFSSAMAQFVLHDTHAEKRRVVDFVDVDSDKWRQYATTVAQPMRWLYQREAKRLLCFENRVAKAFDASVFVSAREAGLFRELAPRAAEKVHHANNGVDFDFFDPSIELPNPYPEGSANIVFTGAMDYWPNVDAVVWFARDILPLVQAQRSDARFVIVGANPSREVQALAERSGVTVTGRVDDIRPYVKHASVAVAPLRLARGVQNKVLEAMALARPTVVTTAGLEGIEAVDGQEVVLANDPETFAVAVLDLMGDPDHAAAMGRAGRDRIEQDFHWTCHMDRISRLLHGVSGSTPDQSAEENLSDG